MTSPGTGGDPAAARLPAPPTDRRLVPAALAGWAVCWAVTGQVRPVLIGLAVVTVLVLIWAIAGRRASGTLVVVVVVLLAVTSGLRVAALTDSRLTQLATQRAVAVVEVSVTGDPRVVGDRRDLMIVPVRVTLVDARGVTTTGSTPAMISAPHHPGTAGVDVGDAGNARRGPPWTLDTVRVGSQWRLSGRLSPADPGDPQAGWLRVGTAEQVAPPGPGWAEIERVRAGLRAAVADRTPEQRALVPALVLGDVSGMLPELEADFRTTGLTHLTAVSGANLTLLLGFVMVLLRWAGVRGRWLRLAGVLTVAVFVALCRTEPSVLRATAMGLVALAAVGHPGQSRRGLRQLAVAAVALLVVDPWLARSAGFALSVLATAGIIAWAGRWADTMTWSPRVVAEAACVPLAAQLATQTVVVGLSGQVSVVGLLANALAGPLVGPATVAGFAAAGLSLIHPLPASWAGHLAALAAQGIISIAEIAARLPGAAMAWPAEPIALLVMACACLAVAWWVPRILARPLVCAVVSLLMVLTISRPPVQPGWPPPGWALVMCDVGQGDAAVVRVDDGTAVVVDTGPDPETLDRCLDALGVGHVALAVISHAHADHDGGAAGLWADGRSVALILVSPLNGDGLDRADWASLAGARGTAVRSTSAGDRYDVAGVGWETLWPSSDEIARRGGPTGNDPPGAGAGSDPESAQENDASVVGRLRRDGLTVLFTGDLEPDGQQRAMAAGIDLRADVLKVPHHGSARQDEGFIAASRARWAITSAGIDNSYGHPAPRTIALLERHGMIIARTDLDGGVALVGTGVQWRLVTQRRLAPCRRARRRHRCRRRLAC